MGKGIIDKLSYSVLKRIKRWMECPVCHNRMTFSKEQAAWVCSDCGYAITEADFLDGFVFWFCDGCGTYLNNQTGFDRKGTTWKCEKCGFENDLSDANIKGQCKDCGILLDNPNATICHDCTIKRLERAEEVLNTTAEICYTVSDILRPDSIEVSTENPELLPNEIDNIYYPDQENKTVERGESMGTHYCPTCGKAMKRTARCEFYCSSCDNTAFDFSLQYDGQKKAKEHRTDFELADFCRGGDLTED